MEFQTLFWAFIVIAALQAIGILMIGQAIKVLLNSPTFRERILKKDKKDKKEITTKVISLIIVVTASTFFNEVYALSPESSELPIISTEHPYYNRTAINILLAINIVLAGMLIYIRSVFKNFYTLAVSPERLKARKKKKKVRIHKLFTDAVPLSEEESILLNHDYDGITELDNNLPPWWKWGFYLTIVVAIIYMVNYHILKTSPLQIEEYEISMLEAEQEVAAYLKEQALNVDENSVTILTAESDINAGHSIFTQYCVTCHVEGGAGSVGPNLTDDYWLYGDKINNIFKTIKYGANNGMKSWKDELNPVQMQQVSSYITTLRGTNPPNPKAAEGDYYSPVVADTTSIEIDSLQLTEPLLEMDTLQ